MNGDGIVNAFDMVLLRTLVCEGGSDDAGDLNQDGETGVADLIQLSRFLLNDK